MATILIVDDQEMMRDSLQATLERAGYDAETAASATEAMEKLRQYPYDLIVTDLKMPQMDGLAFLDELKLLGNEAPVIMMTAYATIQTAVEAMRKGAYDYIQKPFNADEITMLVSRTLDHQRVVKENEAFRVHAADCQNRRELIGGSLVMREVLRKVELVAQSHATVLIRGESGTGKELIAQAIHARSPRANKPMLAVNCAALSSTLLESELFGHEKGAFTGADRMRKGRFELADGGTLLLDEISEMDLRLQAKLLRVLQERTFERVGSSVTRQVDVRVLATTNRPLEEWVREGKFREDLFYRLNVVPMVIPPLRERLNEDLESLCDYFLRQAADRNGGEIKRLSADASRRLRQYSWPGNVRELENLMERVSILAAAQVVTEEMIEGWLEIEESEVLANSQVVEAPVGFDVCRLDDMERVMIERTLDRFGGHRQKTASALGIGVRTLTMKLSKWREEDKQAVGT